MYGANMLLLSVIPMGFHQHNKASTVAGFFYFTSYMGAGLAGIMTGFIVDRWDWNGILILWVAVATIGITAIAKSTYDNSKHPFANGSVIFTQNGYYAREFQKRTDGGMVGINVGIPVSVGMFPFAGHKKSFFGDQHCLGKDGIGFYTESDLVPFTTGCFLLCTL